MASGLMGLSELFETARDRVLLTLPNETYQSCPIVTPGAGAGTPGPVVFLYGPLRSVPREGRYLYTPTLKAAFDARTGDLRSRDPFVPADFGLPNTSGEVLGVHLVGQGLTVDEYTSRRARLFALYDRLAAQFAEGGRGSAGSGAAREFRDLFFSITERPLAACCTAVGRSFFAWIDELAITG